MVLSPVFASLFHAPDLTNVLRAMSLLLITRAFGTIPLALLERNIDFRTRSVCELAGAFSQAVVSLTLAFTGFGVWSIVFGQVTGSAVQSGLAWAVAPLHPNPRKAELGVVRELIRYGRHVSATNILNIVNNTADNVVIGRVLGTTALGFYAVAFRLADFPNSVIAHIVGRVMFPVYSLLQNEVARFRRAFIQNLQRIAVLALPVSVTILVCAEPLVLGLFGQKWEEAIGPLRILAAYGLVKSFTAPGGEVFKGAGRPELGVATGALQIGLVVPLLIVLVRSNGIEGGALAMLIATSVCGVLKLWLALRLLEGRVMELGRALAPSLLCSAVLCGGPPPAHAGDGPARPRVPPARSRLCRRGGLRGRNARVRPEHRRADVDRPQRSGRDPMTSLVAIGRLVTDRKAGLRSLVVKAQAGLFLVALLAPVTAWTGFDRPRAFGGVSVFPSDLIVLAAIGSFFVLRYLSSEDEQPRMLNTLVLKWPLLLFAVCLLPGIWRGHERYGEGLVTQPVRLVFYAGLAAAMTELTARQGFRLVTVGMYADRGLAVDSRRVPHRHRDLADADQHPLHRRDPRALADDGDVPRRPRLVMAIVNIDLETSTRRRLVHGFFGAIAAVGIVLAYGRTTFLALAVVFVFLAWMLPNTRRLALRKWRWWVPAIAAARGRHRRRDARAPRARSSTG